MTERPSLKVLEDKVYFMIFDNGVFVFYYVLMVEAF